MKKITILLLLLAASKFTMAQLTYDTETFPYGGFNVNDYGLWWYQDPATTTSGPMAYLAGYGGIRFFSQNAPRAVLDVNGNFGIGTTSPSAKLHVSSAANYNVIQDQIVANGDINGGTSTNPAYYGGIRLSGSGYDWGAIRTIQTNPNAAWTNRMAFFSMNGDGGSLVERMSIDNSGNVGINTTNTNGYKLAINGSAIATLIKVTANTGGPWPDFVFQPTYKLTTLKETEAYIAQNHHLPDMPSAAEIAKDDINLGEMDKLLTKKVEELTLYLIEKDKDIKTQQTANQELKDQLSAQQKEMDLMKKQLEALTKTLNKK